MPVIATLEELEKDALIKILSEPKNSLIKQYSRLFELDNVEIEFKPEALVSIAERAIKRKVGARGLRSILETFLVDIMYKVPSLKDVSKVVIDETVVSGESEPLIIYSNTASLEDKKSKKKKSKEAKETKTLKDSDSKEKAIAGKED